MIKIYKLKNVYIFKKENEDEFFSTAKDSFIISTFNFASILKYMLFRGLLSPKVLEGVLSEYYNYKE